MTYRNLRFVRLPSDGGMLPVRPFHITFLQNNHTTKLKSLKYNKKPNGGDVEQPVGKIELFLWTTTACSIMLNNNNKRLFSESIPIIISV